MKKLLLTLLTTILFTSITFATILDIPLDTTKNKSTNCIFETDLVTTELSKLSVVDFGEEFIEEPSKPSMMYVKPVAKDYTGFKVEVSKVYHQPLDYSNGIFSIFENVMLERIEETEFSYLTGEFKTAKEATAFIKKSAFNKKLVIVEYKNGVRVK